MSKHKTPEEKLHVSPQVRPKSTVKRQIISANSPAAPKGTNANNQYR